MIDALQSEDLFDLPFDQYARHRIVERVVDSIRRAHGQTALNVLDVGGFPCLTPRFLAGDRVVVIDLPRPDSTLRSPRSTLVWADGCALPFRDAAFDLVV